MLNTTISRNLRQPFHPDDIGWKPQVTTKGKDKKPIMRGTKRVCQAIAFINARGVMNRLDHVVGAENWSDQYSIITERPLTVECALTVFGITKRDVGEGTPSGGLANPVKSAYSDALKRAAVKFGIGRYLYDLPIMWPEFDGWKIVDKPKLPRAALPFIPDFQNLNSDQVLDGFQNIVPSGKLITDAYVQYLEKALASNVKDVEAFILLPTGRPIRTLYSTHIDALVLWLGANKGNDYQVSESAAKHIKKIAPGMKAK